MKVLISIFLFVFSVNMAQAYERHSFGYSVGINGAEEKKGLPVEIKIGFAKEYDPRYDPHSNKIETKIEGFKIYECWPATRADSAKIESCDVIIRHIFVSLEKSKEFEKTFGYVRSEVAGRNPFPGADILDIKEVGNNLKGVLWMVDDVWVLVIK